MKLAIVVPCYNQLNTTKTSIQSLYCGTKTDFTLIVVDDASTDGTQEYFDQLAQSRDIIYIKNPINYGVNRSWNVGIKIARSINADLIAIVNNDLLYTDGWEKPLIDALSDRNIGVVSPLSTSGPNPRDWPRGVQRIPNPAGYIGYMPILGACFMCRTDLFDDIGYFPEELRIYYGDNWLVLASQIKGYKCGYVNSYIHHMMCHTTSKLNNSAIWPVESPIFDRICKRMGETSGSSTFNSLFKPFVQRGERWQDKMNTWRQ